MTPYLIVRSFVIIYARQYGRVYFAFDKGKPAERRGRKVMDPDLGDRQTAEGCTLAVLFFLRGGAPIISDNPVIVSENRMKRSKK